jgi:excisionase family DNA binding protein
MQDVPQLSTASLSTGMGGTSTEGSSQVRSWWDECRPFVHAVSTLPAAHTVLGNDHEQRRRSRSSRIDFGSAAPAMRACEVSGPQGREVRSMEKLLLSPAEAAAQLSIGRSKVYELMRLGQLRSVKIGASRRIPQAAFADFMAALAKELR